MANPLEAFKGLKTWQKWAVGAGGGAAVVGLVVYERKQKAAAAAGAAAVPSTGAAGATAATAGDMVTDPTTGETYPADSVDPATGLTYADELQEYGSVAAADEEGAEAGDQAIEEGLTQTEYDEETGQGTGAATSNAAWVSEVESGLSSLGYSSADIQMGLARYFSSSPQGTAPDGTNLYTMMDTAIGEFGPPPSGTYALVKGGSTSPTPPPGADTVEVPDEVGREDLATAEAAITAAGLVPHAAGDSAKGNKGKVTAQDPKAGSKVSKGSSVTLTYTVSGGTAPPPASGDVTVPDAVGRADLSTAKAVITKAGLKATASAASVKASKGNKGKVSSQDPAAGTKVAKGSTVTLVYTK